MKQQRPLAIVNGRAVTPEGVQSVNIRCVDGLIAQTGAFEPQDGDEVIDA
ncbi:MAG: dihydroorotase, partial [Xanthomonadales bacterium]|nr:dihydroorotase [Xanthomonadales bacterium]